MEVLDVPQGEVRLSRFPVRPNERLRPWDAADELVLAHLAELVEFAGSQPAVLVANGGSGAVPVALSRTARVTAVSDSYVDLEATAENLRRNGLDAVAVDRRDPLSLAGAGPFDVVVVKVPKSLALLEDELCRIRPLLADGAVVVGAGMTKHIHSSTVALFERLIGVTTTSLARKKARLIHAAPDPSLHVGTTPAPSPWPVSVEVVLPSGPARLVNHANVFSRDRLDIGTRFFLDHLPTRDDAVDVVDLGCGNGVVGVEVLRRCPGASVTFVDESYMAVASAKATVDLNVGPGREVRFLVGDVLFRTQPDGARDAAPVTRASVDLVLNNPPFHDDHAVSDAVAWQMFTESHAALRDGGELLVVGNRHLAYHAKLKRIFGNCEVVASNSKFVVYRARR